MTRLFTIFFVTGSLLIISHYALTTSFQPPATYTGAPGDSGICSQCHTGGSSLGTISVATLPTPVDSYDFGKTYDLQVAIDAKAQRFGFEMTVINQDGNTAGLFISGSNSATQTFGNRQYINHFYADSVKTWAFNWESPSWSEGPLTFYLAGVVADSSGSPMGDTVYTNTLVLMPVSKAGFIFGSACIGDTIFFTDISTGSWQSWTWDFGDGDTSTQQHPWHIYQSKDTFNVSLAVSGTSGSDDTTVSVIINPLPAATISLSDSVFCSETQSVSLTGSPANGTFSGLGVTGTTFSPSAAGIGQHFITYSVSDSMGCSDIDSLNVLVEFCSGIEENNQTDITVWLVGNNLSIRSATHGKTITSLAMYDLNGRQLFSLQNLVLDQSIVILPLEPNLNTGVYFLEWENGQSWEMRKVIKAEWPGLRCFRRRRLKPMLSPRRSSYSASMVASIFSEDSRTPTSS